MNPRISTIYSRGPRDSEYAQEARRRELSIMARRLWKDEGIALLRPEEARDDIHAQAIRNEANRKYGRRG